MPITTDIDWPKGLPCLLREGHATQHGQPFHATSMASGRTRYRRKFVSVPSVKQCAWNMTQGQALAFESWFREVLNDGVEWFNMPIRTPMGVMPLVCHFQSMYTGPDAVGAKHWRISAALEIWERTLMPPGWGQFPEFLIGSDIIDIAMNQDWPEPRK